MTFCVDKEESKKGLITVLQSLINTIESDQWDVDDASIEINNNIDRWGVVINSKDVSIQMKLRPVPYRFPENMYLGD